MDATGKTLEEKVKELEKLRGKLERERKKDLAEKEKFYEGQMDVLSKLQVGPEEQAKVQEQMDGIRVQQVEDHNNIIRNSEIKINSVYAQINLLTEFISDGYKLEKK